MGQAELDGEAERAILSWAMAAADYVDAHSAEIEWDYHRAGWEVDKSVEDRVIIHHMIARPGMALGANFAEQLAAFAEWPAAERALQALLSSHEVAPFMVPGVSSEMVAAFHALPAADRIVDGRSVITVDREALERRVSEIVAFLRAGNRWSSRSVLRMRVPEGTRVELEPGIVLRSLEPQDLAWALEFQIIRKRDIWGFAFAPSQYQYSCIEEAGDTLGSGEGIQRSLAQCLVMSGAPEFLPLGQFSTTRLAPPPYGSSSQVINSRELEVTTPAWTADGIGLFADLWRKVREVEPPKSIQLALRRIAMTALRPSLEDQIVDLMVASEALFLSDSGSPLDRGELGYRMAQRAALWAEVADPQGRREVQRLARRAYSVRSAIVHGGALKPKHFDGAEVEPGLRDLRDSLVSLLSTACRRAVLEDWPPDWDAMIFR